MCRAMIVDDEPDVLLLLRIAIETAGIGLSVAAEATGGVQAVERWREVRPDVIVLDQRMPGGSGLDAAREILSEQPDQRIILFSAQLQQTLLDSAAEVGVTCCMAKDRLFDVPGRCKAIGCPDEGC